MLSEILIASAASASVALVMGTFFRWLHHRSVSPLDFPNKELAGDVEQIRVVQIDCPPDKALLAARSAIQSIPKVKNVNTAGRTINAKTGITFRTFGESIVITAVPDAAAQSQLTIQSIPRFPGTTVDYGKNYEIVERIVAHLHTGQSVTLLSANNSFKPTPLRGVGKVP